MNITWYGHRCIRIEAKEGTILIDPAGKVRANDDLVLISAYGTLDVPVGDESLVIRGPGEYERKGIAVRGIQAYQDSQKGKELGLATIYTIVADDMIVCHLGALGQDTLTDEQMELIGDPDILIIPVNNQGGFDIKVAAELATQIEPKVMMPIGENIDKFTKAIGLPAQKSESFRIAKKQLPADQTLLVVLEA